MKPVLLITLGLIAGIAVKAQTQLAIAGSTIKLHFQFQFAGKPLIPGTPYRTGSGDTITFERIRFYAGIFGANTSKPGGESSEITDGYSLVDSDDSSSQTVTVHLSIAGRLTEVNFYLGVDSTSQVSGARSGTLDPLKGMYWTWNSGYVAMKLDGRSPSAGKGGQVEYHLGGYRAPNEVLTLARLKTDSSETLSPGSSAELLIRVDLDRFFGADFSIRKRPSMMTPGPVAKEMMLRFRSCFLSPVSYGKSL